MIKTQPQSVINYITKRQKLETQYKTTHKFSPISIMNLCIYRLADVIVNHAGFVKNLQRRKNSCAALTPFQIWRSRPVPCRPSVLKSGPDKSKVRISYEKIKMSNLKENLCEKL
jgi:hypothetical protein